MTTLFPIAELQSYLDEALPNEEMARIEAALRDDPTLARRLAEIVARRDSGLVSLGEIWRRHRLSCPSRQELGSYLLGVLPDDAARYLAFHMEMAGCRYCEANLADLKSQQAEPPANAEQRRRKYFQSTRAGCGAARRRVRGANRVGDLVGFARSQPFCNVRSRCCAIRVTVHQGIPCSTHPTPTFPRQAAGEQAARRIGSWAFAIAMRAAGKAVLRDWSDWRKAGS